MVADFYPTYLYYATEIYRGFASRFHETDHAGEARAQ
jgi:hypothetical protein